MYNIYYIYIIYHKFVKKIVFSLNIDRKGVAGRARILFLFQLSAVYPPWQWLMFIDRQTQNSTAADEFGLAR